MTGYVSWENFLFEIKNFQTASSSLCDGWELRVLKDEPGHTFLAKRVTKMTEHTPVTDPAAANIREGGNVLARDARNRLVTFEYHVIYSMSYSVPVLYFTAWRQDGSPLSLEEVWGQVPQCYQKQLKKQRWSILTQQEHPLLGRPSFVLHPCQTAQFMKAVLPSCERKESNYLLLWLSTVSPLVGLELPMRYAQLCSIKKNCSVTTSENKLNASNSV
ncbi:autophagy-related 10 [Tachypleus tridentatus]|uniref:autophagy-related 10 n=1 Tax=Tachypleus tridentatus TaxID=6853 RepID=UPI003FD0F0F2